MFFRRFRRRGFLARPRRRRLMVRRPRRVMRARRAINKTNVHHFVRWSSEETPIQVSCNFGSSGVSPLGLNFRLNDVVNPTEFTTLYDQYKIKGVKIYFDYSPDVAGQGGSGNSLIAYYPKLWMKRDYDDSGTPTLTQMTESNQTRCLRFNANRTTLSTFLRPSCLQELYQSSVSTAFSPLWRQWIDCGNPSVPHYGLKLLAQGLPSTNLGAISVRVKYYLAFKNVR